jgi:membrane-associated phospholipid phosphatase
MSQGTSKPPDTVGDALARRVETDLSRARHVPMPDSSSFPSGHAASAFAFAYAIGRPEAARFAPDGVLRRTRGL